MASDRDKTKAERLLEKLKHRVYDLPLTKEQNLAQKGQSEGRKLWETVLREYSEKKVTSWEHLPEFWDTDDDNFHDSAQKARKYRDVDRILDYNSSFRFLDLPQEIRDMIYQFYFDGYKEQKLHQRGEYNYRKRKHSTGVPQREWLHGGRKWLKLNFVCKGQEVLALATISKSLIEHAKDAGLTTTAEKAFERYRAEHDSGKRVWHRGTFCYTSDEDRLVVPVSCRGNVSTSLPPLCITSRQIFAESFVVFYKPKGKFLNFKAAVGNLNFFPLLRFFQFLGKPEIGLFVNPPNIEIELEKGLERGEIIYENQLSNIQRLIELHWINNLPLWPCLTGSKLGNDRTGDCKSPLQCFLYSVRQIVALYHIDRTKWRSLSINHLYLYKAMEDKEQPKSHWIRKSDAKLVEEVIEWLGYVLDYRLQYKGHSCKFCPHGETRASTYWSRTPEFDYARKTRTEEGLAVVHVTSLFLGKVDGSLRQKLGAKYGAWVKTSEKELIPQDLIL